MEDTSEKIKALLSQGSEHEKLDYKTTLDITSTHDIVEITKDIAAMLSSGGGTLLIGADSNGKPTNDLTEVIFSKFDETKLRHALKKYISEPLLIRASTSHTDSHYYILIECDEHPDGFVILKADGQYLNGPKTKEVFKAGDVFVRHGSASERWQQHDIQRIINTRISREKNAWLKEAELILTRIGKGNGTALTDEKKRLKVIIHALKERIKDSTLNQSDIQLAVDKISLTAIKAAQDEEAATFKACIDSLVACYGLGFDHQGRWRLSSSFNPVQLWYEILIRLPLIGGICIETKQYELAKYVALQNVPGDDRRHYRSWYRHALTMSSRANYLPNKSSEEGRSFLSATTNLFRNDIQYKNALQWDNDEGRTFIVCFDYLAAFVILDDIQRIDTSEFYASFAFYDKERVTQLLLELLLDDKTREILFKSRPPQLAYIAQQIDDIARREGDYYWDDHWPFGLSEFMAQEKPF